MNVVKSAEPGEVEHSTRSRLLRHISEDGPVTAKDLAQAEHCSATAIRRHLDGLLAADLIEEHPIRAPRGRGRPARGWVLSEAGHAALASGYGDVAIAALQFLAAEAGGDAVDRFARARARQVTQRYRACVEAAGPQPVWRVDALAAALRRDGYATTARPLPSPQVGHPEPVGGQLCQGHCPVQQVAAQFPQLCEAEADAFSELLGVPVHRLATLAHGDHVCTTYIPVTTTGGR